jgi:hypothetical protein
MRNTGNLSLIPLCAALIFTAIILTSVSTPAQAPATSSAPALQPYNTPDGSAQAGVPPGWKVNKGGETVIQMSGPNGEILNLGTTFIVKDAPYQAGQVPANGIDLSVPNSASLAEKFTHIVETAQFVAKASPPEIKITSATPFTARLGFQCSTLDGSNIGDKGAFTFRAIVCSLPVDSGGTYKVIAKLWQAPPAIADQNKVLAETVLASYRVPQPWLQKKLAPHFAPPPASSVLPAVPLPNDLDPGCFDLAIIREVPADKLPAYCYNHTGPQ